MSLFMSTFEYKSEVWAELVSSPENRTVIDEVLGQSALQAPEKGNPYAPGCVAGSGANLK